MLKALVIALALVTAAAPVWAAEVSGKVQKVDMVDRIVVLEDGTELWVADSVALASLKEGATIKASYEDKDGKKVVTEMEVSQ